MSDKDNVRERLIQLGPECLADILMGLASRSDEANDAVKRATASSSESARRFKSKLAGLKRARGFIEWGRVPDFARKLERMLEDLQAGADDPGAGVKMAAAFFEADHYIFEQCDDSSGLVGDIFKGMARDLFIHYASRYADKAWLVDKLIELYADDGYGVRSTLLEVADKFMPEESLRDLADRLWQRSQQEPEDTYEMRHWLHGVEYIARQIKDAALYEKAERAAWPALSAPAHVSIARVYLESGDAQTALSWLKRAQDQEFISSDRDDLLLAVYQELGDKDKAAEVAWHIFHTYRSEKNLENLLSIIGDDERERVIDNEVSAILSSRELSYSDADFLIAVGRMDEVEAYLLSHADDIDGRYYTRLVPLAERMEKNERWIAASLIYRALLDSILEQGASKYYHHGIRYLKKLDSLAHNIEDWKGFKEHGSYKAGLRQIHGRKTAFWPEYDR